MSLERLLKDWPETPVAACKGCGKKIIWAEKQDGTKVPLDPSPPVYILMRWKDTLTGTWKYRCDQSNEVYVSHFSTCTHANDFSSSAKKRKIVGLVGTYCPDCTMSIVDFRLAKNSIIPMCREDLIQLKQNGDMDRIAKMMTEKETQNAG